MPKKLLLITCTTAGSQEKISGDIAARIIAAGNTCKIIRVTVPTEIPAAIKRIRTRTYDAVVVYGGDGTVIHTIKALTGTPTPILILPGGTANVLAGYYGMPSRIEACLDILLLDTYITERADLAGINGEPFVLDMHAGLWTDAIIATPRHLKKRIGEAAYGLRALQKRRHATAHKYEFIIDTKAPEMIRAYTFLVANQGNHSFLGVPFFPYEHAPGMVQLALVKDLRLRKLLWWFVHKVTTGKHDKNVIDVRRAHSILLERAPKTLLVDDAKVRFKSPIVIKGGEFSVRIIRPPLETGKTMYKVAYHKARQRLHTLSQRIKTMYFGYTPELKYSHVAPNIYLGGKYPRKAYEIFEDWGVTGIISMRTHESPPAPVGISLLRLPTKDWSAPAIRDFKKGVEFINHHVRQGGSVYIHCQLGEGRGPSMAAAYLVTKGFSVDEAVTQLAKYRPFVKPNEKQLKRLAEWQQHYNKKVRGS